MGVKKSITVSAPCKVHLLGEHAVVYGKPAILASIGLRVTTTIASSSVHLRGGTKLSSGSHLGGVIKKVIEPILRKLLKIKKFPSYQVDIQSDAPLGSGLGFSAAVSSAYIAALLSYLKVNWDLNLIYKLTYEAEKTFHGNPSGGDQSAVIYGGLIWFRKESPDLKLIHPLNIKISRLRNFVLINTGRPQENTAEMVKQVRQLYNKKPQMVNQFLEGQENLVKQLLSALKSSDTAMMIRIIRASERNLESIGVVPPSVSYLIRKIEQIGGAVKISGAGGKKGAAGILLAYHPDKKKLLKLVKLFNLPYFTTKLGVEGLRQE